MSDIEKIADALAERLHAGQTRKGNGRPYIEHPRRVAAAVKRHGFGEIIVAAALLHDTVEDCDIPPAGLCSRLIDDGCPPLSAAMIVDLVWQLTSLDKMFPSLAKLNRAQRKEIQRVRLKYVSKPAVIIKVLDRCDNLRDMGLHDADFKKKYIEESSLLFAEAAEAGAVALSEEMDIAIEAARDS